MAAPGGTSSAQVVKEIVSLPKPRRILLFSGKRKSGKDYITNILQDRFDSSQCVTIKISGPIKSHWAKSLHLDLKELLGDGEYKERYRQKMILWGEEMRKKDYGYFCRAAIDMYNAHDVPMWIVSDVRRKTDIRWFSENFSDTCKTIRITSNDEVRRKRGWIFTPGVDDAESECDLDDVNDWDLEVFNNEENIDNILPTILELMK
ncbi:probable phosphomevalonate kinase [Athalia rosae]|uniref:probable phosphomevalonate kinase n=1 Tax=Athalia rosae TaxID=37344 RepID=UPI0020333CE9|nr:probable phosphomevalonate kinase [Athalia rosae]